MNTNELISRLQSIVERHGDLPVTFAISTYEYSVGGIDYADAGPLPNLGKLQKQSDLPERIVIEGKMQG